MNTKTTVDTLLFDLDGTLIDSAKDIVKTVNTILAELNLEEKPFDQIIAYVGGGLSNLMQLSLGPKYYHLLNQSITLYHKHYKSIIAKDLKVFKNVHETLEYFKEKNLIIVTNRNSESAKHLLEVAKLDHYFQLIISGDDPDCLKPSACPILKALTELNLLHTKSMMIGDMDVDILAGKNANILTCAITHGLGKKENLEKLNPDFIINNIFDLKDIIH